MICLATRLVDKFIVYLHVLIILSHFREQQQQIVTMSETPPLLSGGQEIKRSGGQETPPLVLGGQEIRRSGGQETPPLVSGGFVEVPPPHVPFGGSSDYMRMLREAQGVTSTVTSCRTSVIILYPAS